MKYVVSVAMLALSPGLVYAQGSPSAPSCLTERTEIERLKESNAALQMQMMQFQFPQIQKAAEEAKKEKERLQKLLPKPIVEDEKKK